MSNVYVFEIINNQEFARYRGVYNPNGDFVFTKVPYFTMIETSGTSEGYANAYTYPASSNRDYVTKSGIDSMLMLGVRVDLLISNRGIILPLTKIDAYYAYFSNSELSLKVDSNGAVTEEEHNA